MKPMRSLLCVLALGSLAATGLAQGRFAAQKGVREFSGRMIVKPLNPTELSSRGESPTRAHARAYEAWRRIEPLLIRQEEEVGEAIIRVPAGSDENKLSRELMATGLYRYVTPDWKVFPERKPNDPFYARQWHHTNLQAEQGWGLHTGVQTIVAVCDTGVDASHPDLKGSLVKGYNSADDKSEAAGGDVSDIQGHGTHVAGCAAAKGNNGIGGAGVGWNLRIMPVRITNDLGGGAFVSDQLRGARWASENGARAINLSYSGLDDPTNETTGVYIRSRGALFVRSGGNLLQDWRGFDWDHVVVVTATANTDKKTNFSGFGRAVDLGAPGQQVFSTTMGGGYEAWDGSSMAAPLVAGLAGLIWSYVPSLNPLQVEQILYATADKTDLDSQIGHGRINVRRALAMAQQHLSSELPVLATSASATFGSSAGGNAGSLGADDGSFYILRSAGQPRVGQMASLGAAFKVDPAKTLSFQVHATSRTSSSQATTASLFLYNHSTRKDDLVSTVPLKTLDTRLSFAVAPETLAKYRSASGEVKVILRAYAADTRAYGPASPFEVRIDRLSLMASVRK